MFRTDKLHRPKAYIDINKSRRRRVSDFYSKTSGFIRIVEGEVCS